MITEPEIDLTLREFKKLKMRLPEDVIFTDSLSSLVALKRKVTNHSHIADMIGTYNNLVKLQNFVVLVWIPGYVSIKGNEKVDEIAKKNKNM